MVLRLNLQMEKEIKMSESEISELSVKRAQKLLDGGLQAVSKGNQKVARDKFKASAETAPSADALTYWGWMEHQMGNTALAILLCHKAIELDPEFGNPYNDVGSYLVTMGKLDEAIPWFEKAVKAKRYEPRHFPHINLGRIFTNKKMPLRAIREFKKALEYVPGDSEIEAAILKIQQSFH